MDREEGEEAIWESWGRSQETRGRGRWWGACSRSRSCRRQEEAWGEVYGMHIFEWKWRRRGGGTKKEEEDKW